MMLDRWKSSWPGRVVSSLREPLRFVGWSGSAALAVGGAILVLLVSGSVLLAIRNNHALTTALRTQDTRGTIAQIRLNLLLAESGQRGYLLTGKRSYLQPYFEAVGAFGRAMDRLEALSANDPETAPLVAQIKAASTDKFSELDNTIRLDSSGNRMGALALVQTDRGQRDTDRLRDLTGQLGDLQLQRLTTEFEAIRTGSQMLEWANVTGLVFLFGVAGIVGFNLRRAVLALEGARVELATANRDLAVSNETLEGKVVQRTADLTEANDEIQRFAYIVSHDLRAPLVNIMGFTGELEVAAGVIGRGLAAIERSAPDSVTPELREAVEVEVGEAIRFIRSSTGKMDRLIRAILQLARDGRRVLVPEPVAMRATLAGIVETLAHQLAETGAEVTLADMPDLVADRIAVEQVFSNLIENAVKYRRPGRPGRILVRGGAPEPPGAEGGAMPGGAMPGGAMPGRAAFGDAVFEVVDNGRGIAERDLERVFELFRRAGDQSVPGEGIGLAHVRALVRRMDGKIDCESTPDVGSTFRVRLPLQPPRHGATR